MNLEESATDFYFRAPHDVVQVPRFQLPLQPRASSLDPGDVALVRLYGRVYAAHVDQAATQLHLYALDKDQVGTTPGITQRQTVKAKLARACLSIIRVGGGGGCEAARA